MKIRTELLKCMLAKAIKGASCNKLIPITEMLKLQAENGMFVIETTDATNYLCIQNEIDTDDSLYVVVKADLFSSLISRTTSEYVELSVGNNLPVLNVVGNGRYTIELPLNENGDTITFPDPLLDIVGVGADESYTISRSVCNTVLNAVKPSLATTYENPCYTGYYVDADEILATDAYKIAGLKKQLLQRETLVSPEMMDLFAVIPEETVDVRRYGKNYVFTTKTVVIFGPEMEGKEDFAVDAIRGLLDADFDNSCVVDKKEFLSVLDRLSLFISPYDKNAVVLQFTEDELCITSKQSSGIERVKFHGNGGEEFICNVDIEMLIQEAKAVQSDSIEIQYGENNAIKFVDGDLTIVIALLEE